MEHEKFCTRMEMEGVYVVYIHKEDYKILYYESTLHDECVKLWNTGDFLELKIDDYRNQGIQSLDFLYDFQGVTRIDLNIYREVDLTIIYELYSKTLLSYVTGNEYNTLKEINLLYKLERLAQHWHKDIDFGTSCQTLKTLNLDKVKTTNLEFLEEFTNLTSLTLMFGRFKALTGIENLPLTFFELYRCPKLEDIKSLSSINNLEKIYIESCKKIVDLDTTLATLNSIKELKLYKITLESIAFVKNLPCLKSFDFTDSNVKDGDLYPLQEIDFG